MARSKCDKYEDCVKGVKGKNPEHCKYGTGRCYNPYAVCTSNLGYQCREGKMIKSEKRK